ncbi:unnamed protein product [Schistosoma turkestanicum]|nr:unnamed protein product [Schistosoma turkestanicum]
MLSGTFGRLFRRNQSSNITGSGGGVGVVSGPLDMVQYPQNYYPIPNHVNQSMRISASPPIRLGSPMIHTSVTNNVNNNNNNTNNIRYSMQQQQQPLSPQPIVVGSGHQPLSLPPPPPVQYHPSMSNQAQMMQQQHTTTPYGTTTTTDVSV